MYIVTTTELVMGWFHPWVGLGWALGWRLDCVIFLTSWNTLLSVNEYCSWIITFIDSWLVECRVNREVGPTYLFTYNLICHTKCPWWVGLGPEILGWVGLGFEKVTMTNSGLPWTISPMMTNYPIGLTHYSAFAKISRELMNLSLASVTI